MPYGILKVDTITFTNDGIDQSINISGIVASISGNLTATGTISGNVIRGGTTVSGATVTGAVGQFGNLTAVSGIFTTQVSGATVTGTTANFTSGNFTSISGGTHTITSGVFAAGTAANPSISFTSDPNTGIYSPGADQVAISTNGSGRLFVDASGNIGVGTSSDPGSYGARLWVNNATDATFTVNTTGSASISQAVFRNSNSNGEMRLLNATGGPLTFYRSFGNEAMRLDSSGRLGLGTSSPGAAFDVQAGATSDCVAIRSTINTNTGAVGGVVLYGGNSSGTSVAYGGFYGNIQSNTAGSHSGGLRFYIADSGSFSEKMRLTTTGLGIGSTGPIDKLHVECSADEGIVINSQGIDRQKQIYFRFSNTGSGGAIKSDGPLTFWSGSGTPAERGRFDSSGRFLVGTSTSLSSYGINGLFNVASNALLTRDASISYFGNDVYGPIFTLGKSRSGSIGTYTYPTSGDLLGSIGFSGAHTANVRFDLGCRIDAYANQTWTSTALGSYLTFSTTADGASSPTERMRIDNAGKILAGTTSTLHSENKYFFSNSSTGGGEGVFAIRNTASSTYDNAPGLVVYKTSATTTSSARFVQFYASDAGTPMGGIVGNGSSNVQFASISDIRDKENIEPLSGSLDKIKRLEVVSYNWKNSGEHVKAGFIAQNVETVFPEYVVENMASSGEEVRKGITGGLSSGYVAVLTAALQEAIAKIEALEAKVAALEAS